jgi:hypothetical protein
MRRLNVTRATWGLLVAGAIGLGAVGLGACSQSSGAGGMGGDGHAGRINGGDGGALNPDGSPANSDGGPSAIDPGTVTAPSTPYDAKTAYEAVRKIKTLLVGLPPTDSDVMTVEAMGAAGLQSLIISWTTDSSTQGYFRDKMIFFFRNAFQQTGFTPMDDFKPQLLENGGFDFGPLGTGAVGDDAFARLVQNLQDMFAVTTWQLIQDGQPYTQTLTTQKYMMTTGLKSLFLQIEMPNDQPYSFGAKNKIAWKVDFSGNPIPLTDTLNPSSPNYMVFDDEPPANTTGVFYLQPTCRGGTTAGADGGAIAVAPYTGYAQLFQRLLGYTPRYPFVAQPQCWEHPSKPYFTTQDLSDWEWVTIQPKTSSDTYIQPYDLPTLRNTTTLKLALPRVGFYTTPSFLALWNTNDSNQHRVTANQTLLAALGESFTSEDQIVPISESGLDSTHAVTGSACYGCHKSLDPLRQFWGNQLDFNDRNDWITVSFTGAAPNPKPTTTGGTFAFATVNSTGMSMLDVGPLLAQVTDGDPNTPLNQFAAATAQKLCFYANSQACDVTDPEFRRIAFAFQNSTFNFPVLIKELFSSPIVTGAPAAGDGGASPSATDAGPTGAQSVSIARRAHFCAALSNRLGISDICAQAVPLPTSAQTATATIASSVSNDAFSRGAESPVTPSDPNLFFRAAIEELCENLAPLVVDPSGGNGVYSSSNVTTAIDGMVQKIMGYPPSDAHYAQAITILTNHQASALSSAKNNATNALRSTFVLACESPTSVSIGL